MIRVWVKLEPQRIQVSRNGQLHTANYTTDGVVFNYAGDPYLLQACLEAWNPPIDKFELTEQQLGDWGTLSDFQQGN